MTVAGWIELVLVAAAIIGVAVFVVRWTSKSQAAEMAAKTVADEKAFDEKKKAAMTPTPAEQVAKLTPDEVTDEANKL